MREQYRLIRSCGYEPNLQEALGDIDEDEVDADWHFPLPQAEVTLQLRDLNERINRGDECAENNFWRDRPDVYQEAED